MKPGSTVTVSPALLCRVSGGFQNRQFPLRAFPEGSLEAPGQFPGFFQVNVAGGVAGAPADARPVAVLDRGVIDDLFNHLFCPFRRKFRRAADDGEPFRIVGECLRRHEGVPGHVGPDVVGGTLPGVPFSLPAQGVSGTGSGTFAAAVAEMRRHNRIRFELRIGQQKDVTLAGTEFVGQNRTGEAPFAETAIDRALFKIQLVFRLPPPVDLPVIHFEVGFVLFLHHGLIASLRERLEPLFLQKRRDAEQGDRHHILLQNLDGVGGVLIVGGAFLNSPAGAAQLPEGGADHAFRLRHQQTDLRIPAAFRVSDPDQVGAEAAELPDHLLFQRIHNRFFSFRWL